jgi:hypothetical protein
VAKSVPRCTVEFISIKSLAAMGSSAPEVVQGTTHHEIADASFHRRMRSLTTRQRFTAIDVLDPEPVLLGLIGPMLLSRQFLARGFFIGMRISTWGSVNAEARSQPAASR